MPTTREEKPTKPRARSRKADSRKSKSGQRQVSARSEPDVELSAEPVNAMVTEAEAAAVEVAPIDVAPVDVAPIEVAVVEVAVVEIAPVVAMEKAEETPLSGEVLPPEVHAVTSQAAGPQAIAQAYAEYTKKSWINGRVLVERLIAVRSFDEAIEVQGEFAKQAYANFLAQSERICVLYGEWAQQFFRPRVWRL